MWWNWKDARVNYCTSDSDELESEFNGIQVFVRLSSVWMSDFAHVWRFVKDSCAKSLVGSCKWSNLKAWHWSP